MSGILDVKTLINLLPQSHNKNQTLSCLLALVFQAR
jgi:hypothetical protein